MGRWLAAVVISLGGCALAHVPADTRDAGADGGAGDARVPTMTPEDFFARLRDIRCARAVRCEAYDGEDLVAPNIAALCHPDGPGLDLGSIGSPEEELHWLGCGDVVFDDIHAERCLAAIEAERCGAFTPEISEETAVCVDVFRPRPPPGSTCSRWHCPSGQVCLPPLGRELDFDAPRSCQPPRALGEPCQVVGGSAFPDDCGDGLACANRDTPEGVCVGAGRLGEACDGDFYSWAPCAEGLWCLHEQCEVRIAGPGESCFIGCTDEHHCVGEYGDATCMPAPRIGDACVSRLECAADPDCGRRTRCGPNARCVAYACVPLSGPGGPCDGGQECPPAFHCNGSACEPDPTVGERCSDARPCVRGACTDGVCRLRAEGEACSDETEPWFGSCASGRCSGTVCPRVLEVGEPCELEDTVCPHGSWCDLYTEHACVPDLWTLPCGT